MYGDRRSGAYKEGVRSFIVVARQTSGGMVLCVVHVLNVGMRRITLPQESFRATCFCPVSCPAIMFGARTEKEGLLLKRAMKKRTMMTTTDLCSLNTLIP